MSIASEISRLQTAKADLKTAIEGKGVTVPSSAKLDSYSTYVDSIEQEGGGGTSESKSVVFIDYDGTVVQSYTPSEFAALSVLPSNPDHTSEGLVSQGWNWTLSNAKTYVATYGALYIGQMYITNDGATRITIDASEWSNLSFSLTFSQNVSDGVTVNWGDGSSSETMSGTGSKTFNHTFPSRNIYTISLLPSSNCTLTMSYSSSSGMFGSYTTYRNLYNTICFVRIGRGVTSIGSYAFYQCYSLRSTTIPSNVTSIGSNAFNGCYSLQSITIPSNVTSISSSAFYYCYSLQSITIPSNVTSISSSAFYYCYSLQSITIPSNVTSISGSTFQYCYSLQSITIPSKVTSISSSAFRECSSLHSINIPSNVTSIGNGAFYYCYSLQSVTIPNKVTSIGSSAFQNCYSLQSVTIPSNVTSIGDDAFSYCYSLQSITIPSRVTSIGSNAFNSCRSLQSVTIPSNVTSIGSSAFNGCYSLQSVTIPSNVTSIGSSAFNYCYSFQSVTIPNKVTSIGSSAFQNCSSLNCLIFERTTPPTLGGASNSLGSTSLKFPIYVPDSAVEAYKSAYTNYASRIKGISERPQ